MIDTVSTQARMHETMSALAFQYEAHLGVPTDVRAYGAEICADVADLGVEQVLDAAIEVDMAVLSQGRTEELLGTCYERYFAQAPEEFAGDKDKIGEWALQQLKVGVVARRFKTEYAERFPCRAGPGYEQSTVFLRGYTLTFSTIGQYLANP